MPPNGQRWPNDARDNPTESSCTTGLVRLAAAYFENLVDQACRRLGPDHPDTLTSRNNLAYAYRAAGDLGRAIPLFEQTLTDRERVLGPDHPDTLTSRNNLAYAYQAAGDLGRAIPLFEQTLTDTERVLGPDHPQTLTSRNNLAAAYRSSRTDVSDSSGAAGTSAAEPAQAGSRLARYCW